VHQFFCTPPAMNRAAFRSPPSVVGTALRIFWKTIRRMTVFVVFNVLSLESCTAQQKDGCKSKKYAFHSSKGYIFVPFIMIHSIFFDIDGTPGKF